jgi:hypothetical protein
MKNILGFSLFFLMSTLLLAGCNNQVQLTSTVIVTASQTDTPLPTLFPISLSTFTPSPPLPTSSPIPLPKGIFDPFQESIFDPITVPYRVPNHDDIIKTAFGVVHQNSMVEENVLVDSTMGYGLFSLFWEEGDLDLTLIQPDGNEITPSMITPAQYFDPRLIKDYRSIISVSTPGRERYYIVYPQIGQWKMRIFGKSVPANGSNYMIQITSMTATALFNIIDPNDAKNNSKDDAEYKFAPLQRNEHFSGEPIAFTFGIHDNIMAGRKYIHGATMKITIEDPAKTQYSFELYDDGLHKDGKADDGVYANTFTNTSIAGTYNIYLQISGKNNRAQEPFTREYLFSIVVK